MLPEISPESHDRILDIIPTYYSSEYMREAMDIRYHTFDHLANYMDMHPTELEQMMFEAMVRSTTSSLDYYSKYPIDEIHQKLLETVKESDNYWLRLSAQELYLKTRSIDHFLKYYGNIWNFHNPYLEQIARLLPFPLQELKTKDDYYDFLFQIPFVYSFELDFNSFITIRIGENKLPVIQMNYVLFTTLDYFIETVGYVIMESQDKYRNSALREIKKIVEVSKEPAVVAALLSYFKMLEGKIAVVARVNYSQEESDNLHFGLAALIFPFVEFHEFGHLFLAHLNGNYNKEMEFEADNFACLFIRNLIAEKGDTVKFKLYLGLSSFFFLLHCRELICPLANQDQYPTALERMLKIAAKFDKVERARMSKAWNNIVLATDHTLKTVYGIEIPLAETPEENEADRPGKQV